MFERRVKMCEFCGYIVAFKIIFSMKRGYYQGVFSDL